MQKTLNITVRSQDWVLLILWWRIWGPCYHNRITKGAVLDLCRHRSYIIFCYTASAFFLFHVSGCFAWQTIVALITVALLPHHPKANGKVPEKHSLILEYR